MKVVAVIFIILWCGSLLAGIDGLDKGIYTIGQVVIAQAFVTLLVGFGILVALGDGWHEPLM